LGIVCSLLFSWAVDHGVFPYHGRLSVVGAVERRPPPFLKAGGIFIELTGAVRQFE